MNAARSGSPLSSRKSANTSRVLTFLKWGLVPSWATTPDDGYRPTNARSYSLHKPTFRAAFKGKRCLVPAGGFYEG
jgi:putative SOS response-associated peptidase YedK